MRLRRPRTWLGRVLTAGALVVGAGIAMHYLLPTRGPGKIIATTGTYICYAAFVALLIHVTIHELRQKPDGTPEGFWAIGPLTLTLGIAANQMLIFLATQGNAAASPARSAPINRDGLLPRLEAFALAECLLYSLLFGPEIIRRKLPFERASEQALRFVPAGLGVIAAIVTGSYLLVLHFFNQSLSTIPPGPLAASILAVMTLLAPLYQFIARACWRYGLADFLDPMAWWAKWRTVTDEVRFFRFNQAVRKRKEQQATDST